MAAIRPHISAYGNIMSYVARDPNGYITAVYKDATDGTTEQLPLTNPEVRQFLSQCDSTDSLATALGESDLAMVRVTEDLIDILVNKGVFLFLELPQEVREKYTARGALRGRLTELLGLIDDDVGI